MKTPNNNFRKRLLASRRRGSALMETVAALAIAAVLAVIYINLQQGESDRIVAKNTADRLKTVGEAAKGYLTANYSTLLATAPTSGALVIKVGRTTPGGAVPSGSLQEKGFLPSGFVDTNAFQQNTALLVRKINSTTLDAMLTTYGGREIPDRMLGSTAKLVGEAGGFVPKTYPLASDAGDILGIGGGWRSEASEWGAAATRPDTGSLQMTMNFEDGSLLKDFLYRNDVGNPEANRMNTHIDMNKQALNNTGKITGIDDSVTGGTAVIIGDASAANSLRATRDIWADRDVHATGNVNADKDVTAKNDVKAGNDVTAARNVVAQETVAGRNVMASNDVTAGNDVKATRDLVATRNLEVAQNGNIKGDLTAGRLNINAKVFGDDVSGGARAFRADVTLGDLLPRMVPQFSYVVVDASPAKAVPKPTCRGGYANARIMVYRQVDSSKTVPNVPLNVSTTTLNGSTVVNAVSVNGSSSWVQMTQGIQANDNGLSWTINWVGDPKADNTTRQAIAQTFCYYGED
ncbi:shufflon system plasmid conjugative transfer pilus tip adhesin PilV [Rhizobium laguerreae]|uniref:shufflon system plasmid conjugative transfer pilus tip adhesin PilV n=1 Tax=Rhizobium laguerreae TaxID=1076926 RepID=UPI001C9298F2|nr:shufflon system plasmid conjugative transfer pilus tip adhesin PilV [Rhizobium laguerreae]MBY3151261.1 shufflon system plasmid conjugative transfer pilus tip adhesin PilV [Rhizobium laguerreae]MBY3433453.1 shufflon system plasmid conjugative transfer pilus tip adhesin PilV [Rhizobium laguerreae]